VRRRRKFKTVSRYQITIIVETLARKKILTDELGCGQDKSQAQGVRLKVQGELRCEVWDVGYVISDFGLREA
jgi:hypothetical protein